jgi:DnaJ like chaperone protein
VSFKVEMMWQGKALGALIGVLTAGPVGALFGSFIGHLFDAQVESGSAAARVGHTSSYGVQEAFFRATFQVMGHLAKADGRVSEDDIRAARAMMSELRLGRAEVRLAIELFNQGKAASFPLDSTLQGLHALCRKRGDLRRMFVQIQLQAVLWGGGVDPTARKLLSRVCAALDVSAYELVQMEALLRMQSGRPSNAQTAADRLAAAYQVLGVTVSASDGEVTKAYRRLMNQNHPDKLHAKGLPESMMKVADEKTRQIRAAYEVLRDARGMK